MSDADHAAAGIDVVLRIHDPARMLEFDRAVFSVVHQSYRPARLIVVTQRFEPDAVDRVTAHLAALAEGEDLRMAVLNFTAAEPPDARSALLNLGIDAAAGRYIAFLDYDDIVYHNSYAALIGQLREGGAAIAFGRITISDLRVFPDYVYCTTKHRERYKGRTLIDLFHGNFCPVHSFVIDRSAVDPADLRFEEPLTRNEDYDFLVRFCAKYPSDFGQIDRQIGEYSLKDDGSNTILVGPATEGSIEGWSEAEEFLQRRRESVYLSPAVKQRLGLPLGEALTVRDALARSPSRA